MTTLPQEPAPTTERETVSALVALYLAGQIDRPTLAEHVASVVFSAMIRLSISAEAFLFRAYGWEPLGIAPGAPALERLRESLETVAEDAEDDDDLVTRVERIAKSAPDESHRQTLRARMERAGVLRWRWVATVDACPDCAARHNETFPIETPFRDHPGCECTLQPVEEGQP